MLSLQFVLRHQKFNALTNSRGAYWQLLSDRDERMLPWLEAFQVRDQMAQPVPGLSFGEQLLYGCGELLQRGAVTCCSPCSPAEGHVSAVGLVLLALARLMLSSACRSLLPMGGAPCLGHLTGRRSAITTQP